MSDALSALFQKLLDVIDALKGPCFVILFIIGVLYVRRDNPFGIYALLNRYPDLPAILFFIWLAAGVLCLFSIVKWLRKNIQNAFGQRANIKQKQEKLHHLTQEQKQVIANLLQPDQTYHYFSPSDLIEELEYEDIVRGTGIPVPGYNGQYVPTWAPRFYILQGWARGYLSRHPALLQLAQTQK